VFFTTGNSWRDFSGLDPGCFTLRGKDSHQPLIRSLGGPMKRSGERDDDKNLAATETRTSTPQWPNL
jgi:hypothetical protein